MERSGSLIPTRIQAQLLALGIPAAKHGRDELAGLFPSEFNIKATALSAEDVARVLVDLVGRKIIAAPGTAFSSSTRKVKPGWHACRFYRDVDQLIALVAPYIAEGLNNGEGCLWVISEPVTQETAINALAPLVDDVHACLATGQLDLVPHASWYFDSAGKFKSFDELVVAFLGKQDRALAKGFKFLRATGDAGWVSGTEQSRAFIDYETRVNAALGSTQIAAACTYRADVTAEEFVAIVLAHQDALNKD